MSRSDVSKSWLVPVAAGLFCLLWAISAFADAKADISISPQGACAGGTTFVIANNNANSSIHATVTQSDSQTASVTTIEISLLPKEQKVLGCAPQGPAGNFLVTWQVQSAQYQ
jgi:hypothetical protein